VVEDPAGFEGVGFAGVVLLAVDAVSLLLDDESPAGFLSPSCFDSVLASLSLEDVEEAEFDRPPA
jgi:hypothetical protein